MKKKLIMTACIVAALLIGVCAGIAITIHSAQFAGWTDEDEYQISFFDGRRVDTYFGNYDVLNDK
jgi:hypothetical protein